MSDDNGNIIKPSKIKIGLKLTDRHERNPLKVQQAKRRKSIRTSEARKRRLNKQLKRISRHA